MVLSAIATREGWVLSSSRSGVRPGIHWRRSSRRNQMRPRPSWASLMDLCAWRSVQLLTIAIRGAVVIAALSGTDGPSADSHQGGVLRHRRFEISWRNRGQKANSALAQQPLYVQEHDHLVRLIRFGAGDSDDVLGVDGGLASRRGLYLLRVLIALAVLSGCSGQSAYVAELREHNTALSTRVQTLEEELKKQKSMLSEVIFKQVIGELNTSTSLTPGESGYRLLKYDLGVLTVSLGDIEPYANGSRVQLVLCNLSGAAVDGLKAKIEWGTVGPDGSQIDETRKSKEENFAQRLQAGAWTSLTVVLPNTPPADLGFVTISDVGHRSIFPRK